MKKIVGIGLILLALALGYLGIDKVSNSEASVEVIGVELSASDEGAKTTGFIYIGLALASLLGGVSLVKRNS